MSAESWTPASTREALATQNRRAYELLRSQIRSGRVERDAPLSENELMRMTGLPRSSVRHALTRLSDEGLVERQRHVGTHVVGSQYLIPVDEILPSETPPGFMYRKLSDRSIPMIPLVSVALECQDDTVGVLEQVFEHVTTVGREPVGVRTAYYRSHVHQPASWPTCPSLAFSFEYVFGKPLGDVETVIDAIAADDRTASLLGIPVGSPTLVREQRLIDADGTPQEYSFTHYRADRVSFPLHDRDGRLPALISVKSRTPEVLPYRARHLAAS